MSNNLLKRLLLPLLFGMGAAAFLQMPSSKEFIKNELVVFFTYLDSIKDNSVKIAQVD